MDGTCQLQAPCFCNGYFLNGGKCLYPVNANDVDWCRSASALMTRQIDTNDKTFVVRSDHIRFGRECCGPNYVLIVVRYKGLGRTVQELWYVPTEGGRNRVTDVGTQAR